MKLTKGRISKLFNKKRQTAKKYKNKKKNHVVKTFRKNTHINLHNSTLKKTLKGGENSENNIEPITNITSSPVEESIVKEQERQIELPELPESAKEVPTFEKAKENVEEENRKFLEELDNIEIPVNDRKDEIIVVDLPVEKEEKETQELVSTGPTDEDINLMSEEKAAAKIVNDALRDFSGGKRKKKTKGKILKRNLTLKKRN